MVMAVKMTLTGETLILEMKLNCSLLCSSLILHDVQMNRTFNDSKYFVDQPSNASSCSIRSKYLTNQPWQQLFKQPGSDLNRPYVSYTKQGEDKSFDGFINDIDNKWDLLTLESKQKWRIQTSVNMPFPFIIPGGRFREMYYWDNYFIIKGLLVTSNKIPRHLFTAYGIIQNFMYLIKSHGFIPNGSRYYYLNRSQPPLFTWMVWTYYKSTKNNTLLFEALPLIHQEIEFFHSQRMSKIVKNYSTYDVFHYDSDNTLPRPESYFEDFTLLNSSKFKQESELYRHIGAAAESGWDFSSRWYHRNFKEMQTAKVIPVDLNFIMLKNYRLISKMMRIVRNGRLARYYAGLYQKRFKEYHKLFYNNESKMWYDILPTAEHNKQYYASNLTPLWTVFDEIRNKINLTEMSLYISKVNQKTGIPVSLLKTGQQWDYPNVWPPMHYLIIQGVIKFDIVLATKLAHDFIANVYCIWKNNEVIYEKYNCCEREAGRGGEYKVQEGFGWTNGVIVDLVDKFGSSESCPIFEDEKSNSAEKQKDPYEQIKPWPRILMIFGESILLCGVLMLFKKR
eukprot:NODE_170_length_16226_cov_0.451169.p3 type:complete len:564 gc:universal NODE_170_length_16226_cov_0.451169:140-1831(+)